MKGNIKKYIEDINEMINNIKKYSCELKIIVTHSIKTASDNRNIDKAELV